MKIKYAERCIKMKKKKRKRGYAIHICTRTLNNVNSRRRKKTTLGERRRKKESFIHCKKYI